jgi:molecular chaperone DnaK (HSP70)
MPLLKIEEPDQIKTGSEQETELVVGIDLGTTNSLIAIIEDEKLRLFTDKDVNTIQLSPYYIDIPEVSINNVPMIQEGLETFSIGSALSRTE